jgi:hypothetical protein
MVETISVERLEEILGAVSFRTNVILVALTEPEMRKTNNPYLGRVQRRSRRLCTIGLSYQDAVNEARILEGKPAGFVAKPRKSGVRVGDSPLLDFNGKLQLEVIVLQDLESEWLVDGQPTPKDVLEPWLPDSGTATRQDLQNPVVYRTFHLTSIREMITPFGHYEVA